MEKNARGWPHFARPSCKRERLRYLTARYFSQNVEVGHSAKNRLPAVALLSRAAASQSESCRHGLVGCAGESGRGEADAAAQRSRLLWAIRHARTRLQRGCAECEADRGPRDHT